MTYWTVTIHLQILSNVDFLPALFKHRSPQRQLWSPCGLACPDRFQIHCAERLEEVETLGTSTVTEASDLCNLRACFGAVDLCQWGGAFPCPTQTAWGQMTLLSLMTCSLHSYVTHLDMYILGLVFIFTIPTVWMVSPQARIWAPWGSCISTAYFLAFLELSIVRELRKSWLTGT